MRRAREPKAKDEHLIFVKNVPTYIATRAITDLYAPYKPIRIKNVYPNSDITTVVLGFQTQREASHAQQDTDGMRLENVVLRVESYSKHRSVRHIQEERNGSRPLGAVDQDGEAEAKEKLESRQGLEYEIVFPSLVGHARQDATGATTWAQMANHARHANSAIEVESSPILVQKTKIAEETKEPKLSIPVAIPSQIYGANDDGAEPRPANAAGLLAESPEALSADLTGYECDIEGNHTNKKALPRAKEMPVKSTSIFEPWAPIDSSERLRQRHSRDCAFCQIRARSQREMGHSR